MLGYAMTRRGRLLRAVAYIVGAVTLVFALLAFVGETIRECDSVCEPVIVHVYHPVRGLVILTFGALVVTALAILARGEDPANTKDAPWTAKLGRNA
jgi:hypothetical protein